MPKSCAAWAGRKVDALRQQETRQERISTPGETASAAKRERASRG
jgi:hypothetical protein